MYFAAEARGKKHENHQKEASLFFIQHQSQSAFAASERASEALAAFCYTDDFEMKMKRKDLRQKIGGLFLFIFNWLSNERS